VEDDEMAEPTDSQHILCQIANCAFEVVSKLLHRDQLLAEALRSSATTSRQIFREECITLDMVSTLKERFPDRIEITVFTAPEETRNGADWYWRIQKANGAIHARVQAKRIQRSAFGHQDSEGTIQIDAGQLQRLIAAAELDRNHLPSLQTWIATYARYDATPPCNRDPSDCRNHACGDSCAGLRRIPSIWIAQAKEFVDSGRQHQRRAIRDIVESSLRLDCILPCIDRPEAIGPDAKGFVLNTNLPPYEACVATIQSDPALSSTFAGALQIRL
jgi:hypothetical protein